MRSLIVVPTYNEYENLGPLQEQIFSFAPHTDLLIVDDNSPDGTGNLADELAAANPKIHVIHREGKLGLGTAYIAGFKFAVEHGYDVAFEMDADFSHDPRYLPAFLEAIKQADLVIGSRYVEGGGTPNWSLFRRFISGGGNTFARPRLMAPLLKVYYVKHVVSPDVVPLEYKRFDVRPSSQLISGRYASHSLAVVAPSEHPATMVGHGLIRAAYKQLLN